MKEKKQFDYTKQKIETVDLEKEMRKSYIDYAMSVIVSRALPDIRDGLKPVHRRIIYAMYEDNLTPDRAYRKSATTVGDVLGRYHPHGDASVYDALVRLAQDFSLRYPLVDGHGNFGSIDGHPAAAYRYTEARLAKVAMDMVTDIEKDTVDFDINFDNTRKEPKTLPSRFPNLLVNGSSGIAVGMATNIPPHNLNETIDAVIHLIDNPEAELADLMECLPGPDFPTGGIIYGKSGIRAAYSTGRGRIKIRAKAEIEEKDNGRQRIVVTEIPYQVNKSRLVESIADLVNNKQIEGISDLRDETDRDGIKVVIELKRDANAQVVLNQLYASTQMQITFGIILLALVNGEPKILSLKEILKDYISYQEEVIIRRTKFDLKKAQDRAHILEGLRIAIDNVDEIISIIRKSYNDAKQRLMERFSLTEVQAQAILDLKLGRLQGLEREKIENEYNALLTKIKEYQEILGDVNKVLEIIKTELTEIKDRFGDERRTEIAMVEDEIDIEDLIEEEDCVYTLTNCGYIKRQPVSMYKTQNRGGRGITAMTTKEEDFVNTIFVASTHDYIMFFTNLGRLYKVKGYRIPEASRIAKGNNIINILPLDQGEKITAMMPIREFVEDQFIMMFTRNGTVKRMKLCDLDTARKTGIRAIILDENDELIAVRRTSGDENVIIATRKGMAICFNENDVRPMWRDAMGVRGIKLDDDDYVIGAEHAFPKTQLLTVTDKGYGKRTAMEDYMKGSDDEELRVQKRGGKGRISYNITQKTGLAASVVAVTDDDDIILITDDGVMIRMEAKDINLYGRTTQGVIVKKVPDGIKVIGVARVATAKIGESADEDEEG